MAVTFLKAATLAQVVNENNMWGIIHMLVEMFMKKDDGKYVMMKVRQEGYRPHLPRV